MDGQTSKQVDEWVKYERSDGEMDERTDGQSDRWNGQQTNDKREKGTGVERQKDLLFQIHRTFLWGLCREKV